MSSCTETSSAAAPVKEAQAGVALAVTAPKLTNFDAATIRVFLDEYDQYCRTVIARARQCYSHSTSTEAATTMELKFCVDPTYMISLIELDCVKGVSSFEAMTYNQLRNYLDNEAKEDKETMTKEAFTGLITTRLQMDMSHSSATARMKDLFVRYNALLKEHGVSWIKSEHQKLAVSHVVAAIKPKHLKERLESDLDFAHRDLKKDFSKFFAHALKVAAAYQLVDAGRKPINKRHKDPEKDKDQIRTPPDPKVPLCLYEPCKAKGIRHYMRDCRECPKDKKKELLNQFRESKTEGGPSDNTRSKTRTRNNPDGKTPPDGKTARLKTSGSGTGHNMTLVDGEASITCDGRCDDGSDETIASSALANMAVAQGIGKIDRLRTPVKIAVALTNKEEQDRTNTFTFSRC